jgi:hypothetical protein
MKFNINTIISTYFTRSGTVSITNSCPYLREICNPCDRGTKSICQCRCCGSSSHVCIRWQKKKTFMVSDEYTNCCLLCQERDMCESVCQYIYIGETQ